MSSCLSSKCNYQPFSQSQKMSIGIFVDSVAKSREKEASNVGHSMVNHNAQRRVKVSSSVTKGENKMQEGSVRATTGLLATNLMTNDSDHIVNHLSRAATSSLCGKQPSFRNQAMPELGAGNKIEADRTSGKESKGVFIDETSQKFPVANKQQVCTPVSPIKKLENRSKETLMMKLRQVLGQFPSGDKINDNSGTQEVDADEMMREKTLKAEVHFKPWQNSDTIETDSENADLKIKKPVTRSFVRRRAPARMKQRNLKFKSLSCDKEGHQGADIFSFDEKSAPSPPCAVKRVCSVVEKKYIAKRSCGIKPADKLSPKADLSNNQPEKIGCEKAQLIEESSLVGGEKSSKHDCLVENREPEVTVHNSHVSRSPIAREKSQVPTPAPQEKSEHLEPNKDQSPVWHADDLNIPWYKVTKTVPNSPMGSYPLMNDKKQSFIDSVQQEGGAVLKAKCFSTSSEKEISEFSDDEDKLEDSLASTPKPSSEKQNAEHGIFTPVRGELDSPEEVSSANKVYPDVDDVDTSPEIRLAGKPMLFRSKRHCNHDAGFSDLSPTMTPKSRANADDVFMCFDGTPEDGLTRVVSLLGLALEKIKNKVISATNKKCSEILLSAAEELHSQLQRVESQIQTDLGKITDLKASKRKHLEIRLQEQREHLKLMHEKFKEEVCRYLQDCKGAMEGMETQHIELQGAIEKQKSLHRKLLLQTEAVVETHLIDAQRQMMSVRKLGKQKMQQLKVIIAECLKG